MVEKVATCVVGGQWGSEGKGKIVDFLRNEYNAMIRSGGPQAGHTFYHGGAKYVNRQIPCGVFNPDCLLYLAPASIINLDVLAEEIVRYGLYPDRLMIDPHAMVITENHIDAERRSTLKKRVASTTQGVGAAQSGKIWREDPVFSHYAHEDPELYWYCGDETKAVNRHIDMGQPVLIEGTQGIGLSLDFGEYPFVTSRNVTSSALLTDAGISPKAHDHTIMVIRTYPIRVGGNSGPVSSAELAWNEITKRSGSPMPIEERTTVTGRIRRVFEQDCGMIHKAIEINRPDQIALMHLDYINANDRGKQSFETLSNRSKKYVKNLERDLDVPITLIGTGPEEWEIIDMRDITQIRNPAELDMRDFEDIFPANFYGAEWTDGYPSDFIRRKMTDKNGNLWKTKIFA